MNIIDRIFLAVFDRYRRVPGHGVESSWRAADYQVASYLTWPFVLLIVAIFLVAWPDHRAATVIQRRAAQTVTIAVGLLMGYLLHRRFKRFLTEPPPLSPTEAKGDARLVLVFKVVTIGVFLTGCAIVHHFGSAPPR
jgi:hypothetical protein